VKIGLLLPMLAFIFISCNEFDNKTGDADNNDHGRKLPGKMKYSFDCLKTDSTESDFAEKADELIGKIVTLNIDVSDEEQMRYGDTFLIESVKNKQFKIDAENPIQYKLDTILNNLVKQRIKPTDIEYKLYVLDDDKTINAYTVGGKIFITTAMLNKVKSDDQLYAIIGHEIGHNEKGHIKSSLKQIKAGKKFFGDWGEVAVALKRLLTGSFNQKYELEADYYGLDLTWKAGYDICAIKPFWDELAKGEQKEDWYDFFRTHPYSDIRSKCLGNHISSNFNMNCK
jgi:predicted Zn-dependent protease